MLNQIPFILGLGIVMFFSLTILGPKLDYFPGDLGDARFNNYILEHDHKFFTGQVGSYFDGSFMYPEPKVISYSDNLLGSAPIYSLYRIVGFDRETAFQLWILSMFLLCFTTCYLFLNWFFKNRKAAVVGALVFTFSMAVQSQLAHAQTFPRYIIPIAFWFTFLFIKDFNPKYFFWLAFTVVYQIYCGIYLGFFLAIPVFIMLLAAFINKYKRVLSRMKNYRWSLSMIVAVVVNVLLVLPIGIPYLNRSKMLPERMYEDIEHSIPTLRSFFYAKDGGYLWSGLERTGEMYPAFWDHKIFVGGLAMVGLLIFILGITRFFFIRGKSSSKLNDSSSLIIFFGMLCTFVLFFKYQDHSFYRVLFELPGFSALRSLTRIINVELIFFAFGTAYFANIILTKFIKYQSILFVAFLMFFIVDNYHSDGYKRVSKDLAQERVNILVRKMEYLSEGSIVSYEPKEKIGKVIEHQIDAMLAAQELNLISVNGYSATSPYGYYFFWKDINEEGRKIWFKEKKISADNVIVID